MLMNSVVGIVVPNNHGDAQFKPACRLSSKFFITNGKFGKPREAIRLVQIWHEDQCLVDSSFRVSALCSGWTLRCKKERVFNKEKRMNRVNLTINLDVVPAPQQTEQAVDHGELGAMKIALEEMLRRVEELLPLTQNGELVYLGGDEQGSYLRRKV